MLDQNDYQTYPDYLPQQQEQQISIDWGEVTTNAAITISGVQVLLFLARHNASLQPFGGALVGLALTGTLILAVTSKDSFMRFFALLGFGAIAVGAFSAAWDFVALVFSDFSGYFLPYQMGISAVILVVGFVFLKLMLMKNERF